LRDKSAVDHQLRTGDERGFVCPVEKGVLEKVVAHTFWIGETPRPWLCASTRPGQEQLSASPMMSAPGYLDTIPANEPVSVTVPSTITTAPAGITPDAPRRGSVIAYALRMMVSVISLHPLQFGTPAGASPDETFRRILARR
jgi:hypothetical protein